MEHITIKGGGYIAVIDVEHGANCISLENTEHNASILRKRGGYDTVDNPFLYGMPLLFPVNRISNGRFLFEGREYAFPINEEKTGCHLHGALHNMRFETVLLTDNSVKCSLRSEKGQIYSGFPHAFEIRQQYVLSEAGLTHTVEIVNDSPCNMPCMIGFHTTFDTAFAGKGKVKARVDISEEYKRNMDLYLPESYTSELDSVADSLRNGTFLPNESEISRHFLAQRGGKMVLTNEDKGLSVIYDPDPELQYRLIYGQAKGFLCMEPQSCLVDAPNMQHWGQRAEIPYVTPYGIRRYTSKIYLNNEK